MRSLTLTILFSIFSITFAEQLIENPLTCKFESTIYSSRTFYTCIAVDLKIHEDSFKISQVIGEHLDGKSNLDVDALIIDREDIKFLPSNLNEIFPSLERIEVINTKLEKISKENFNGLNLEVLKLSKNQIRVIESDAFEGLKTLEKLFLDRNKIQNLNDEIFASTNSLKVLRLENNNLKAISENLLQNLPELRELFISDNKIQKLTAETFKNNENLEILDVSHNSLKFVDTKIIENLNKFDFSENDCTRMTVLNENWNNVEIDEVTRILEEFCGNENFDPIVDSIPKTSDSCDENDLNLKISDLELEKSEIERKTEELMERHQKEKDDLIIKVNILEAKLKKSGNDQELKLMEEELKKIKQEQEIFEAEKKRHRKELEDVQDIISQYQSKISKISYEKEDLKLKNSKLEKEIEDLKVKNLNLEMENRNLKNLKNCETDRRDFEERMKVYQEQITKTTKDLTECQSGLKCCEVKTKEVLEKFQKYQKDPSKIPSNLQKPSNSQFNREQIKILTNQLDDCNKKFLNFQQKCTDVEVFHPQDTSNQKLKKCQKSLEIFSNFPLECEFYTIDSEYTCEASKIISNHRFMGISATHGNHRSLKSNYDVDKLKIINSIFKFITNDIFEHFPKLQLLEIINSKLSDIQKPKIESKTLKSLHIEFNEVKIISRDSFKGVKELQELILNNNGIELIESGAFDGIFKLQKLNLKANKMSSLPTGIFKDLSEITHLSVSENKLESLSGDLLKNLVNLQVVKFDGNPIKIIEENLLNYSRRLKKIDFTGTCVGDDLNGNEDLRDVRWRIEINCKN